MNNNDIIRFIQAGNSTFTLVSNKINTRYTYKVREDKNNPDRFYVRVLYGPDNNFDYRFLGWFYRENLTLHWSTKSCVSKPTQTPFTMMQYFLQILCERDDLPNTCEFLPSGRCGRCGRVLTTPESIHLGIGPECIKLI